MKLLLTAINAKYIHSNPAIYSLAAYAGEYLNAEEKEKCEITLAEYTINHKPEFIYGDIYRKKPDIIGFSCYIWNWDYVREVIRELHKLLPDTLIYLGGPEVSFTAEKILQDFPFLLGIMEGEGEESFLQLCRFYAKEENRFLVPKIPGFFIRTKNLSKEETFREENATKEEVIFSDHKLVRENPYEKVMDMSRIPFLYKTMEDFENRIVYYESSRGCPYRCSYCLSSIDKHLRFRSYEQVEEELRFFLDRKVPQVKFIDRTFNANRDHACRIWEFILEHDNGVTNFHFEVSADILGEREFALMERMRPGLIQLEIGVQSVNKETLKEIRRGMNLEKLRENTSRIHGFGNIHQHLDLIAGLPYEDYESFKNSFNEVCGMQPDQLQLGFLKVLKGSYMWEKAEEYGIAYTDRPPYEVLFTKWLSFDEILQLKKIEEMLEIYYNSDQFSYTIAMLEKEFETPFQLYEALALYYEEMGYYVQSPSRAYRYQILLNFCERKAGNKLEMFRQLLVYDIYLREKIKTRPEFALLSEEQKKVSTDIYKKEEEERVLLPDYREYNSKQLSKMTHLEVFQYRVWEKGSCEEMKASCAVLFDYKKRNPLTRDAFTIVIENVNKN